MDRVLRYFSFRGRANRQRYWLTSLALYGVLFVAAILVFSIPIVGSVVFAAAFLAALVAGLAVAVRRLHDRGKSGWWLLPMYLPLGLFSALAEVAGASSPEAKLGFSVLSLPFSLWIFVELGCLRGTVGPNRFGSDPLLPESTAEVFS